MLTRPDPSQLNGTFEGPPPERLVDWLLHHGASSGLEVTREAMEDVHETYLDTSDRWLHRAGYCLALRRRGEVTDAVLAPRRGPGVEPPPGASHQNENGTGTVERAARPLTSVIGIHQHEPSADLLLQGTDRVADRVRTIVGRRPLVPLLTIERTRHSVRLAQRTVRQASIVIDESAVTPLPDGEPRRLTRFHLHLEPSVGPEAHSLLQVMRSTCQLRPALPMTYELACEVTAALLPLVVPDLGETDVREDHSVGDASLAVVRRQLQTWLQHEAGTRLGEDIEELHDMRVAIRRMREAIRLFRPFLPEPVLGFRNDLKWLGRILGEVRDLDVQIEQLVAWKGTLPIADASALEALHTRLEERRRESRIRMLDGLDSPRYDDLVTRMATALREPEIPTMAREVPVQVVAPSLLTRAHARILRDGRKIGPGSPPQRYHDLRIRCKQLRYALEFHHPLYEAEASLVIRRLVQLQNLLGRHQDADVAVHWLREEALGERGSLPLSTSFVVGRLVERYTTEAARLREGFPGAFAQLSGKRWKRLQSAMASGYEQGLTRAFRTGPRLELL